MKSVDFPFLFPFRAICSLEVEELLSKQSLDQTVHKPSKRFALSEAVHACGCFTSCCHVNELL